MELDIRSIAYDGYKREIIEYQQVKIITQRVSCLMDSHLESPEACSHILFL